jgi:hypothetical protein
VYRHEKIFTEKKMEVYEVTTLIKTVCRDCEVRVVLLDDGSRGAPTDFINGACVYGHMLYEEVKLSAGVVCNINPHPTAMLPEKAYGVDDVTLVYVLKLLSRVPEDVHIEPRFFLTVFPCPLF